MPFVITLMYDYLTNLQSKEIGKVILNCSIMYLDYLISPSSYFNFFLFVNVDI